MCGGYRIRPRSIYRLAANAVIITDFVRSGVGCGNVEMAAVRVWRVWDPAANGPNEYVGRGLRPKHGVPEPSLRVPHAKRLPKDRDVPDVSGVRTIRPCHSKCAGLSLDLIATLRSSPDAHPPRWGSSVIESRLV